MPETAIDWGSLVLPWDVGWSNGRNVRIERMVSPTITFHGLTKNPGLLDDTHQNRIFNSLCLLKALLFRRLFLWNLATERCQKPCTLRPTQQCLLCGPVPHKYYMRCKQLALPAFDPLRGTMVAFLDGRISMNRVQDARQFMGQPPCLLVQDFSITGYDSVPL